MNNYLSKMQDAFAIYAIAQDTQVRTGPTTCEHTPAVL